MCVRVYVCNKYYVCYVAVLYMHYLIITQLLRIFLFLLR